MKIKDMARILMLMAAVYAVMGSLVVLQETPNDKLIGTASAATAFNCTAKGVALNNVSMQLDGVWQAPVSAGGANAKVAQWTVNLASSADYQPWSCKACNATECVETVNKTIYIFTGANLCDSNCSATVTGTGTSLNLTIPSATRCLFWCRISNSTNFCNPTIDLQNKSRVDAEIKMLDAGRGSSSYCMIAGTYKSNSSSNEKIVIGNNTNNILLAVGGVSLVAASIAYLLRRR